MKESKQIEGVGEATGRVESANSTPSHITRLTVARLYNLGSYEHVRYELSVEVPDGQSASKALLGTERLLAALNPKSPYPSETEIAHDKRRVERMKELLGKGEEEFRRENTHFVGTPEEYIARCEESVSEAVNRRQEWKSRQQRARQLFDDLGGAAKWHDAKLEWDKDDY